MITDELINLDKDTVLDYALMNYDGYVKSEFAEDYKIFRYIRRLLQRHKMTGELKENLILNHITMVYNLFGTEAGTRLLFYKVDKEYYSILKTFLLLLNTMPQVVPGINGEDLVSGEIPVDMDIAKVLRRI